MDYNNDYGDYRDQKDAALEQFEALTDRQLLMLALSMLLEHVPSVPASHPTIDALKEILLSRGRDRDAVFRERCK
jgi:hypothetical protein